MCKALGYGLRGLKPKPRIRGKPLSNKPVFKACSLRMTRPSLSGEGFLIGGPQHPKPPKPKPQTPTPKHETPCTSKAPTPEALKHIPVLPQPQTPNAPKPACSGTCPQYTSTESTTSSSMSLAFLFCSFPRVWVKYRLLLFVGVCGFHKLGLKIWVSLLFKVFEDILASNQGHLIFVVFV